MRFSIRDLLWFTLVVAMGLGWWTDYRIAKQAGRLRDALRDAKVSDQFKADEINSLAMRLAKELNDRSLKEHGVGFELLHHYEDVRPDWSILDEPPVEP